MKSDYTKAWSILFIVAGILGLCGCSSSIWQKWNVRPVDWQSVQNAGGIRIGTPEIKEGQTLLPVECDLSGLHEITTPPTQINSALVVQSVNAQRKGAVILLQVNARLIDPTTEQTKADNSRIHYADLTGIPAGIYEVYYERAGVEGQHLGRITLP
jgi:hypothetical protein